MNKTVLYPTDLTDEQWALLRRVLPPRKRTTKRGRPPADLRRICNGLLYSVRAGGAWRLLPRDFGPWQTVYHYFRLWTKQGYWETIHDLLRDAVRLQAGKRKEPTAAILDSQTVRSADQGGERGYDAAKKTKGIKRHILVDTLGLLLGVCVTPADVPERHAHAAGGVQPDMAIDARAGVPPAIAPVVADAHGQHVFAGAELGRQVIGKCRVSVGVIAQQAAVQPDVAVS